jgi:hypothetical protein
MLAAHWLDRLRRASSGSAARAYASLPAKRRRNCAGSDSVSRLPCRVPDPRDRELEVRFRGIRCDDRPRPPADVSVGRAGHGWSLGPFHAHARHCNRHFDGDRRVQAVAPAARQGLELAGPAGSKGATTISPLLLNASAAVMHASMSRALAPLFRQSALQLAKLGNVAVPIRRFKAAAISCLISCSRESPTGDTHNPSIAERASSTPVRAIEMPHTESGPWLSIRLCVIAGWFL